MDTSESHLEIDIPTLVAISITAWALVDLLHEIVGHGGAALLMGIPVRAISTTTIYIPWDQVQSIRQYRILHIGGTFINLLTGGIAFLLLYFHKSLSRATRCFLWLFTTMSFVVVIMYLVSATAIGGGDWMEVIFELEPRNLFLGLIIGTGILFAVPGYALPLKAWMPDLKGHRSILLKVTMIPVLTLIITWILSIVRSPFAFHPPGGGHLILSIFVSLHFILWAILVNVIPVPRSSVGIESIHLPRSTVWLVIGMIAFVLFVLVIGPGLGPLGEDPRLL
jgi:hypothetical protein